MIRNKLSTILGEQRMRVSELSKLTGISQNALNKIYHNKTKGIDFDTLNKLCNALQKNSQEIFEYVPDQSVDNIVAVFTAVVSVGWGFYPNSADCHAELADCELRAELDGKMAKPLQTSIVDPLNASNQTVSASLVLDYEISQFYLKILIVTKCKNEFKNASNPVIMSLCYAMLCWAGHCGKFLGRFVFYVYVGNM